MLEPTYQHESVSLMTTTPTQIAEADLLGGLYVEPPQIEALDLSTITPPVKSKEKQYIEPQNTSVLCNCYAFVDSVVDLPHTSVIKNNLVESGNVAVFYYQESELYHYALVTETAGSTITISETNFSSCEYGKRVVRMDDKHLIGFYNTTG